MQGANAMLARHEKSMERNQVSTLLLRQLKLSNVGEKVLHVNGLQGCSDMVRYFMPLGNPSLLLITSQRGDHYRQSIMNYLTRLLIS